jgi:hypothetical protein
MSMMKPLKTFYSERGEGRGAEAYARTTDKTLFVFHSWPLRIPGARFLAVGRRDRIRPARLTGAGRRTSARLP